MNVLVVVAHPRRPSLTHSLAQSLRDGVVAADPSATTELADLSAEGFDPRFTVPDIARQRGEGPAPADVVTEQDRLDRADALALVYPVYWWAMPALLKGWIDRVFANGWAYVEGADGSVDKRLGRLQVHLLAVAGGDARTFTRHGYSSAMRTQIDHGIFDYCGAPVLTSELLLESETAAPQPQLDAAHAIGRAVVAGALPAA